MLYSGGRAAISVLFQYPICIIVRTVFFRFVMESVERFQNLDLIIELSLQGRTQQNKTTLENLLAVIKCLNLKTMRIQQKGVNWNQKHIL